MNTTTFEQAIACVLVHKLMSSIEMDADPLQFSEDDFRLAIAVFTAFTLTARFDRETLFMAIALVMVGFALTNESRIRSDRATMQEQAAAVHAQTQPTQQIRSPLVLQPF